jgi:hypothetical protein
MEGSNSGYLVKWVQIREEVGREENRSEVKWSELK